ncbi:MAG: hypothetical protein M1827_001002 [Pycnora praestabilis]|nr:MAG: hypothetical protein M1827_001002 [Pycnora praestabilis]
MTVGWLTMLYDPETSPSQEMLQILSRIRLSDNPLNTRSFHTFSQDCSLVGQPLSNLLQVFGNNIIPQSTTRQHQGTGGNANPYNSEYLILSYLNYRTLTMVANIRVEWVDTLSLHLEFDEEHRVLKVFRFPSFCRLIYAGSTDRTALCRLFSSRLSDDEVGFQSTSNLEPREFFREVLLSYRLLFSQDRGSRRTFRQEQRRRITRKDNDNIGTCDPLLLKLCGYRWQNERKLYEDLRAPDPHNYYSPVYDFPFLGQRLLELQRFSKGQNPHDWKLLWYDRRDIMRFYTFWAVLWIGGGTIILGILQIIVAVLQLAANYDQNRLQAISNGQRA